MNIKWTMASLAFVLSAGLATQAPARNLVVNGSFEPQTPGGSGLAGWSIGGKSTDTPMPLPPVAIAYGQNSRYPTGAQGEAEEIAPWSVRARSAWLGRMPASAAVGRRIRSGALMGRDTRRSARIWQGGALGGPAKQPMQAP